MQTSLFEIPQLNETHQPRCNDCGLMDGKGDAKELAKAIIANCFYEYEEKKKKISQDSPVKYTE